MCSHMTPACDIEALWRISLLLEKRSLLKLEYFFSWFYFFVNNEGKKQKQSDSSLIIIKKCSISCDIDWLILSPSNTAKLQQIKGFISTLINMTQCGIVNTEICVNAPFLAFLRLSWLLTPGTSSMCLETWMTMASFMWVVNLKKKKKTWDLKDWTFCFGVWILNHALWRVIIPGLLIQMI